MALTPEERRQVAFLERDYNVSTSASGNAQSAVVASRSVGFTLVAALLGVGVGRTSVPLLVSAIFAIISVYLVDAYYSWRAKERDTYLRDLEEILGAHYVAMTRAPKNERELNRLRRRLASHRVGSTTRIRTYRWSNFRYAQPWTVFRLLYPVIFVAAILATALAGISQNESTESEEDAARLELVPGGRNSD